jgi:Predicted membrane protein
MAALRRRRNREALVQALKAGLAAVLAITAAAAIGGGPPFLAPYAAVLAVTSTVRRSWSGAARQAAMLVVGVCWPTRLGGSCRGLRRHSPRSS